VRLIRRVVRLTSAVPEPRLHQRQVLADRRRADAELAARRAQAAGAREDREEAEVGGLDDGRAGVMDGAIVSFRLKMV
jgi:hypothetical protein